MTQMTLLLLRHGESESNVGRIYAGSRVDLPLTEVGIQQARLQASALQGIRVDAIHSSPLRRAKQTALTISSHIGIEPAYHWALQEVDVGILEGTDQDESAIKIRHDRVVQKWEQGEHHIPFPDGESLEKIEGRLRGFLESLQGGESAQIRLVVGHCMLFMAAIWLFR